MFFCQIGTKICKIVNAAKGIIKQKFFYSLTGTQMEQTSCNHNSFIYLIVG